ncbi:MAG TPA: hypothetical protein VFR39_02900, partial [Burkholderiales bacterium]|nr:hypothetical protein [Burkholderiales bacterium]
MSAALKVSVLTAALLATFCLAPSPARAQTAAAASGNGWTFDFTPYVWGVAMGGDVQGGSLPAIHIDMSFSDILHTLDAGLLAAFEARKGRWGMLFDSIYMKLEGSGTASRTGAGPIGSTANAGAELEVAQTMLAAAVAYRVGEGRAPIDVIGGLRYAKIEADATIDGSLFAQSGTAARSAK